MLTEKDFEDIICKYPDLIEEGLTLKGRQITLFGRRMDILFEDKFKRKLIIELKIGPIKDEYIGQILSYEGMLLSADDPTIRVMLVGNRVPPNIQKSLDHHGIAWKEITVTKIKDYLANKGDMEFLNKTSEEKIELKNNLNLAIVEKNKKLPVCESLEKHPALFVPVESRWINQAFDYFKTGKEKLYFYTNSNIGTAISLGIKNIYFKLKGTTEISVKADFIEILEDNPVAFRLPGAEERTGKYYYGYKNLRLLTNKVNLIDLKYFTTENNLKIDIPGACIIIDPKVE